MRIKFDGPADAIAHILDTVAKVRNMAGYTGAHGDDPADVWIGTPLHDIEDAARYLSQFAPTTTPR